MEDESAEQTDTRIKKLWEKLDVRKEGFLDIAALKAGFKKLDHPLQRASDDLVADILRVADIDGDGRIQYDDFRRFLGETESTLRSLFKRIDHDNDGRLDKNELRQAFSLAGVRVPDSKLEDFFANVDTNNDGAITFNEWRDFLLFLPPRSIGLKAVMSYYQSTLKVNAEGDVLLSDDTIRGLGTILSFLNSHTFGSLLRLFHRPRIKDVDNMSYYDQNNISMGEEEAHQPVLLDVDVVVDSVSDLLTQLQRIKTILISSVPHPGYFIAGGVAGVTSRTMTAPLDRLKVYLIAHTGPLEEILSQPSSGGSSKATKLGAGTLARACKDLWGNGGIRNLFAGNGLNVVKVMPESAVKFGSYEAAKRAVARLEGHDDPKRISSASQFVAGGVAGMISQAVTYPLDTLKFRMQNETVKGSLTGNALIIDTAKKMWMKDRFRSFYRGLTMGLVGMFPYAAIDLGTFEYLKKTLVARRMKQTGCTREEAVPGNFALAITGGMSGAIGASAVYPVNLLRTRLQAQGTASHPRTYTGIVDVARQTIQGEGFRGLFKGLTPNLLKVIPAVSITYVVYENTKKALHLR